MVSKHQVLVFAAKRVGRELVDYLCQLKVPIGHLVVATVNDKDILITANQYHVQAEVYNDTTQSRLAQRQERYSWLLNLWCPHRLLPSTLALAEHRLNIHSSFVPHCRGNDNAAWAIRKGLPAGVSLIEMEDTIDSGDVFVQRKVPIAFPMRGYELHARLQDEAISLFKNTWSDIYRGEIKPKPQSGVVTSHTRKQTNADRVRDAAERMSLGEAMNWILAHDFWPGTTAELVIHGKRYRVRVEIEPLSD